MVITPIENVNKWNFNHFFSLIYTRKRIKVSCFEQPIEQPIEQPYPSSQKEKRHNKTAYTYCKSTLYSLKSIV